MSRCHGLDAWNNSSRRAVNLEKMWIWETETKLGSPTDTLGSLSKFFSAGPPSHRGGKETGRVGRGGRTGYQRYRLIQLQKRGIRLQQMSLTVIKINLIVSWEDIVCCFAGVCETWEHGDPAGDPSMGKEADRFQLQFLGIPVVVFQSQVKFPWDWGVPESPIW